MKGVCLGKLNFITVTISLRKSDRPASATVASGKCLLSLSGTGLCTKDL